MDMSLPPRESSSLLQPVQGAGCFGNGEPGSAPTSSWLTAAWEGTEMDLTLTEGKVSRWAPLLVPCRKPSC